MTREIILDTETTGLSPYEGHRIIEIGALEMINKVITGKKFHYYINPERDVPFEAYRIHGIAGEFLKDKQKFHEIALEFVEFIQDSPIIAHNAQFDAKFLNHELKRVKIKNYPKERFIDTLEIAKRKFPGMRVNLDALCQRFKIDNTARKLHGALLDAALLADVYIELLGGRQASFLMDENNKIENRIKLNSKKNSYAVKIIKPTEEELTKHRQFLANIPLPIWY